MKLCNDSQLKTGFKGFIFDLDGTLLNTLPDLVVVTNMALAKHGFPPHSTENILSFVGSGGGYLIRCAVPEGTSQEKADEVLEDFKALYPTHGVLLTKEYENMTKVLTQLKKQGKKLGVLSNKFDAGVQGVITDFFPGLIDIAHGESALIPRKPNPEGLRITIEELGLKPDECIYFGDSGGDMKVACANGIYAVGVLWGYRDKEILIENGACALIEKPTEILSFM